MKDMKVRKGGRLSFTVTRADSTAISATFIAVFGETVIQDTVAYNSSGVAAFEFDETDTDVVGVYEYQVNENFSSGAPDIYPSMDDCDGDCDLPTLEICESLSEVI
jgi:hypothetical protein